MKKHITTSVSGMWRREVW